MTLRLILVRHGLSDFNKERRIQGRIDLSLLSEEGRYQALKAGQALNGTPIDAIYSSPLQRAAETTKIISKELETNAIPEYVDDLLEIDLDKWSGLTINEVESKYPELYSIWKEDPENLELIRNDKTSFNPIKDLSNQADIFVNKLLSYYPVESNSNILIIAHNAILRCIILKLLNKPDKGFRRIQLNNASISIINLNKGKGSKLKAQIECLNNITHQDAKIPIKGENQRIILVRHGETDWNLQGRFQGQIDIPLNNNGRSQAKFAEKFLREIQIDKAFCSSLSRPKETAEIILNSHHNVPLKEENGLIEIGHGEWEGKLESEIKVKWADLLQTWHEFPDQVKMPKGETIKEVWDRSIKCWEEICSSLLKTETAIIVAHDAVNKTILCYLLGLKEKDIWTIKQGNGGITIIDYNPDPNKASKVTCLNITTHLGGSLIDTTAKGAL